MTTAKDTSKLHIKDVYIFFYNAGFSHLDQNNPYELRKESRVRFPCGPNVVVQFRIHNLRVQIVVLVQLN